MNPADSPHNSFPSDVEGTERPNAQPAFIRGLGTALEKFEKIKSKREITAKDSEGQETKGDPGLVGLSIISERN